MEFTAIDVETANADVSSICQVGMASYADGRLTREWKTYVDPEDFFDGWNVSIHGIAEETVKGAPTFPEVLEAINESVCGRVAVCHTHFDRVAVRRAAAKYGLGAPDCTWLDTARVARRAWSDLFSQTGYGLANVCKHLGYKFRHHDALEDAKAAAHILLCATRDAGMDVGEWINRVELPLGSDTCGHTREGNPQGLLYGEVLVFTGALQIPRAQAADMAAKAGCRVAANVNKKTTLLVVGDQDVRRLAGADKSTKHRKAEELIAGGHSIRIIGESVFSEVVSCYISNR